MPSVRIRYRAINKLLDVDENQPLNTYIPNIDTVQRHHDDGGQRVLLGGSVPATFGTPPKVTVIRQDRHSGTPHVQQVGGDFR
uniref:Uncharacterized protein n=1 Tax=Plectus sambesii TaxID=2011161 RepID=A0A914W672_9BILA